MWAVQKKAARLDGQEHIRYIMGIDLYDRSQEEEIA